VLATFGAMMTLGQQVYAQNNNRNNGNNNDDNNGNNNDNDDGSPSPIEYQPGQFPVGDGCVDCEGPCSTVFYKPEHYRTV
jgi:hypothetical protein